MPTLNISLKPDTKAVSRFESRRATPSSISSADWEKIAPAIREKCFFSARVNNAEVLGKMRELIGEAVNSAKRDPQKAMMSRDKFISEMKDYLRGKGYAVGGSALTDITSRRRLGLIYQMNVDEAREYGRYVRGQDSDLLNSYPAWEFLRIEERRVPRSNWRERWLAAGGKIYGGRMVALKSDAVWVNLSRFGRPYPPFDFGSGMGVEDVDRTEAINLGLLPDDEPADEVPDFECVLESEVSLERIPEDMRWQFIKDTPNAEIRGDKLLMRDKPKMPTWKDMGLESAKTWNLRPYAETKIADAKKSLKETETIKSPLGEDVVFSEEIHWLKNKNEKAPNDINGRLKIYPIAKDTVINSEEIWLNNGFRNHLIAYQNKKGELKGCAVATRPDGYVHTYFPDTVEKLNEWRKGTLIYKKGGGE